METTRLPLDGFLWYLIFEHFSKICRENSIFIKIRQELTVLYMKTFAHLWYLTEFFIDWEMFQSNVVEKIKILFLFSVNSFPKFVPFMRWKGKCKAVPLQACSGPEGSRKLRFPDFMTTAQDGGKVVSLAHRPPLPPGNTPGTHFC